MPDRLADTRLLVGCPVSRREWVLPAWFDHVEAACDAAGLDHVGFVFVAEEADPSVQLIAERSKDAQLIWSGEPARTDERTWQEAGRYAHMAQLRNLLLGAVRQAAPDLFLSLDSDVLLDVDALSEMVYMVGELEFGAASSKTFMTRRGRAAPNFGHLVGYGGLLRSDATAVASVDVIMAIKLMTPAAYQIDYVADGQAEDLGWCTAARSAGVRLGWSGRVCSKHVMSPAMLDVVDERCGF